MDVLIKNSDMVTDSSFSPLYIQGAEEVLQRVDFALMTPKGKFIYNRDMGLEESDTDISEKGIRGLEARCREAVMNIEGVTLDVVSAERTENGRIKAIVTIDYQGEKYKREVII